jgi:phospholipase/carboxylesterase
LSKNQIETIIIDNFVTRVVNLERGKTFPMLILLHGLTGDEDAMWVFTRKLLHHFILVAPRGLFSSPLGGYSWHSHDLNTWPSVDDFSPAVDKILSVIKPGYVENGDFSKFYLLGFSQGAALAYTLALFYPEKIASFAGLSGFLPDYDESLILKKPLNGISGYIAHGIKDSLVPVDKARYSAQRLEEAGAEIDYCERKVGHKLSSSCFRDMESFFLSQIT